MSWTSALLLAWGLGCLLTLGVRFWLEVAFARLDGRRLTLAVLLDPMHYPGHPIGEWKALIHPRSLIPSVLLAAFFWPLLLFGHLCLLYLVANSNDPPARAMKAFAWVLLVALFWPLLLFPLGFWRRGTRRCPQCRQRLRTNEARQCFACGADWHNQNPSCAH